MLNFNPAAMAALQTSRAQAFVLRLLGELERMFPELLGPLPAFVRLTMVGNGLDHAVAWGLSFESTLAQFVALQCETAADFHQHPDVQVLLAQTTGDQQERMQLVLRHVPQTTWNEIKRGADIRAWFEPQRSDQRAARMAVRVCTMLPELAQRIAEATLLSFFEAAPQRAGRHGIEVEAGICVFAASLAFYGDALDQPNGPAWAREIFLGSSRLGPEKIVALLRYALALDIDRVI